MSGSRAWDRELRADDGVTPSTRGGSIAPAASHSRTHLACVPASGPGNESAQRTFVRVPSNEHASRPVDRRTPVAPRTRWPPRSTGDGRSAPALSNRCHRPGHGPGPGACTRLRRASGVATRRSEAPRSGAQAQPGECRSAFVPVLPRVRCARSATQRSTSCLLNSSSELISGTGTRKCDVRTRSAAQHAASRSGFGAGRSVLERDSDSAVAAPHPVNFRSRQPRTSITAIAELSTTGGLCLRTTSSSFGCGIKITRSSAQRCAGTIRRTPVSLHSRGKACMKIGPEYGCVITNRATFRSMPACRIVASPKSTCASPAQRSAWLYGVASSEPSDRPRGSHESNRVCRPNREDEGRGR